MQLSEFYLKTYKDCPVETQIESLKLLYRAGFLKLIDNGSYSYTPIGKLFVDKLKDKIYETFGGFLNLELTGDNCGLIDSYLSELKSYKELPLNISYQDKTINNKYKFKDGLFNPKMDNKIRLICAIDASQTDQTLEDYTNKINQLFKEMNVSFKTLKNNQDTSFIWSNEYDLVEALEADENGGLLDEVYIDSEIEDSNEDLLQIEEVYTPNIRTIDELVEFMNISANKLIKTLLFNVKGELIAVSLRGDRDLNKKFLARYLHVNEDEIIMANEDEVKEATNARTGFAGPIGINARFIVDEEVVHIKNAVVGANKDEFHIKNVSFGRDFKTKEIGNFKMAFDGCKISNQTAKLFKGSKLISIQNKVSSYSYLNSSGREEKLVLLSIDLYLDRLISAIVEENRDDKGIVWPDGFSPMDYYVIIGNAKNEEEVEIGKKIYERFVRDGFNVILDDRKERIGFKFKDSELIGIAESVIIGKKISENLVEFKDRQSGEVEEMKLDILI